jgi:phosphohistidine phosphatase
LISAQLPAIKKSSTHQKLYLAAPLTIYEVLKQASNETVIMLGHNPGIGEFANDLAIQASDHPQSRQYPTAATTIITFNIHDWSTLLMGTGTVIDFIVPRDLKE